MPFKLRVTFSPEIRDADPLGVVISPLFVTCWPIKATAPPSKAEIFPLFSIEPALNSFSNIILLFKKSLFFMLRDDAIIEPTSTFDPSLNMTPLGLINITFPFAVKFPYM